MCTGFRGTDRCAHRACAFLNPEGLGQRLVSLTHRPCGAKRWRSASKDGRAKHGGKSVCWVGSVSRWIQDLFGDPPGTLGGLTALSFGAALASLRRSLMKCCLNTSLIWRRALQNPSKSNDTSTTMT